MLGSEKGRERLGYNYVSVEEGRRKGKGPHRRQGGERFIIEKGQRGKHTRE